MGRLNVGEDAGKGSLCGRCHSQHQDLDEIPVCVGYEINGEVTTDFPVTHLLEKAKPVLKTLPGWKCDIRGIKKYEDLHRYVRPPLTFVFI